MTRIKKLGPGVALCLVLAVPSWLLGRAFPIVGGPVFAILLGMALALLLKDRGAAQAGVAYTSKKILQYAVILLGFGLNLSEIARVGAASLPIILSTISTSLIVSFLLYQLMKMPANIFTLIGVGSSICGGSAIAATAPVIDAGDEEIAQSISVIFLFNIMAALIFPTLGGVLGLSNEGFGLFAGTAVNDTSSVTATAAAWDGMHPGANTLDQATIVKAHPHPGHHPHYPGPGPVAHRQGQTDRRHRGEQLLPEKGVSLLHPVFHLALGNHHGGRLRGVDAGAFQPLKELSKFLIIMAMGAIGLNTDLVKLVRTGGRPILMGVCCWAAIAAVSLGMQHVLGIW